MTSEKRTDDTGIFGIFAALNDFAAQNVAAEQLPLFADAPSIQLRDDQLGPDPMVSERARHDGTDYGTAQMSLEFDRAVDDYIHLSSRKAH